ncbi:MAG: M55 family metallopeptidase [Chloroflexi bacterium]|nr:M55 family metallopeptidase [Chloroflexota bacterium]
MRVYISVDMEGIAGVNASKPTERGHDAYPRSAALMTGEANAAIEGAFDAGAEEVVVNDSHGRMYNLPPEDLDGRARLVQGIKAWSMVEAAAIGQFDVALFVGYHTRAGHPRGTLAHTYTGGPTLTTLAGRPTGEYGINALYLGALGVPVGMVAGDDALAEEVAGWLPWAERVVVKRAISWQAAEAPHPARARELVREGAQRAVENARDGALEPLRLDPPIEVGIDFRHGGQADLAGLIPGFRREGDRGVRYTAAEGVEAYRAFVSAVRMATLAEE